METKHTPGEFLIDDDTFVYALSKDGVNRFFCGLQAGYDDNGKRTSKEELAANARLFAAAPELLVALREALATIDDYLTYEHNGDPWTEDVRAMGEMDIDDYSRDGRLEKARAAIAKATGAP